ncbi:NAD-dependent epimerase/dehydratase family protein [Prauserella endophytica]|uniref:UDP-glucose 4-epimerase n=1 Tax=Prauserella endophytica TaxID=1592324 RepID=A0ABY2S0B4_9PSEU|nr:NAD-dependent epimerase/dehydratase family protein [Prauserella endophytica]TKG67532.1 UDP-glucose 4-epimerase [Prauserella endophytica]
MRVLVTGSSGFLGRAVVAALRLHGHDVSTMHRGVDATHRGDIRDRDVVGQAVSGVEAVCHLAALAKVRDSFNRPAEYWSTNVVGTLNVLEALAAASDSGSPKSLVLASTSAVYGTPERQPMDEETPTVPSNPYGRSKLAADQAAADVAQLGAIGVTTLRAFNIAGSSGGQPDPDLTRLIPKVLAVQAGTEPKLTVNGNGSAVRDFVHVEDAAEAFALALPACTPGQWRAYNLGATRASVAEVIQEAEKVTGRPAPLLHRPPANEPPTLVADSTRARQELGWQPKKSELPQILRDAWDALNC